MPIRRSLSSTTGMRRTCLRPISSMTSGDGPTKTMLGADQKRWLMEGLAASTATFKLLASAVPFLPPGAVDEWTRYATERDELRAFLRRERIRNVTILSAGQHAAYEQAQGGLHEFLAGSIGGTAFGRGRRSSEPDEGTSRIIPPGELMPSAESVRLARRSKDAILGQAPTRRSIHRRSRGRVP